MLVQSFDPANPDLLFSHGGPGMTDFFGAGLSHGAGAHFTIVWWQQRGAGMSFSSDIPLETMTMDQMIADTVDVTEYLRALQPGPHPATRPFLGKLPRDSSRGGGA
jgi:pimeloyl-ACP methyl ester carboxylesterase